MVEACNSKIRLFCDSEIVFQNLVENGKVSSDVEVYTRSFVIENNPHINSIYMDEKVTDRFRSEFKSSIFSSEREAGENLENSMVSFSHKLIFQQVYNRFQSDLLDGVLLDGVKEYSGKTFIAFPLTGHSDLDDVTRPNWIDWLSEDVNTYVLKIKIPFHNERAARGNVKTSLVDRLRLGGVEALIWKLFKLNAIPSLFFKTNDIAILGQTEIMKDYVASCISRGLLPRNLMAPLIDSAAMEPDFDAADYLLDICKTPLNFRLLCLKSVKLKELATRILRTRLATALSTYQVYFRAWDDVLCAQPKLKYVMSGYQKGPRGRALADACSKHNLKIIACQHGITRELLENVKERSIFFESSFCDAFVAANRTSSKITKNLNRQTKRLEALTCLPPRELIRAKAVKQPKFDVLFISTTLYSGHKPNGVPPTTDRNLSEKDQALVENILSKTNKTVHYKPYPSIRQIDHDPVLASVRPKSNMKVVGAHEELRYMMSNYRMLITTRATSTVSWAVASGRPLIFIDHFCHARLSKAARKAFKDAFFYFDQQDPEFGAKVRTFIMQPFSNIEEQWAEKVALREKTIQTFFTENSGMGVYNTIKLAQKNLESIP